MTDEWVLTAGVVGLFCGLTALVATWAIGRENLLLRDALRAAKRDAAQHARERDCEFAEVCRLRGSEGKTRYLLRKVWASRRVLQYLAGKDYGAGYTAGVGDAAQVMLRNADARLADTRSLAMCEELYRG